MACNPQYITHSRSAVLCSVFLFKRRLCSTLLSGITNVTNKRIHLCYRIVYHLQVAAWKMPCHAARRLSVFIRLFVVIMGFLSWKKENFFCSCEPKGCPMERLVVTSVHVMWMCCMGWANAVLMCRVSTWHVQQQVRVYRVTKVRCPDLLFRCILLKETTSLLMRLFVCLLVVRWCGESCHWTVSYTVHVHLYSQCTLCHATVERVSTEMFWRSSHSHEPDCCLYLIVEQKYTT